MGENVIEEVETMPRKPSPREAAKAPTRNVVSFTQLTETVVNRGNSLPGMACFYGPSGYGKTFSATSGANLFESFYVEMGASWTPKTLIQQIAREVGVVGLEKASIPHMMMLTADRLADEPGRPLIIDEADNLVKKNMIDLVRELHDKSQAAIILIGEELMPEKLRQFERSHNRMLDWVKALPCDLHDARLLARYTAPRLDIADDLLETIISKCDGRARRIVVNLSHAVELAAVMNRQRVTLSDWGSRPFFTGEPPRRRAV